MHSILASLGTLVAVAYPENLLTTGEQIVLHKHPHWKMLVVPVLVFLVVVGAFSYLAALAAGLSWHQYAWIGLAVVGVVLILWFTVGPLFRWRTTHFIVTTDRVMSRWGVIKRTGLDIPLSRINSVQFRHGIIDRLFRCGTLVIESASEEPLEFDDIPEVERVHMVLYREINDNPEDDFAREEYREGDWR
ncbi:PH domain-containing protein [Sciscionella marina]|uniref:PH domain-containing protein n=1 Tax=Sciscionella marina TaxID=508770 RepID=UPI00037F704E